MSSMRRSSRSCSTVSRLTCIAASRSARVLLLRAGRLDAVLRLAVGFQHREVLLDLADHLVAHVVVDAQLVRKAGQRIEGGPRGLGLGEPALVVLGAGGKVRPPDDAPAAADPARRW